MEYQVSFTHCQADFVGFMRASSHQRTVLLALGAVSKVLSRLAGGFFVLMGGMGIFNCFSALITGGIPARLAGDPTFWVTLASLSALFLGLGLFLFFRSSEGTMGRWIWRRYREKGSVLTYRFEPDCFHSVLPASAHRFDYSVIQNIYEDPLRYYLFVGRGVGHILPKAAFGAGDLEEFLAFLAGRTGLPVTRIR